nr:MAG TPA: hypothetical protein [Caudoviricetes sp.]
MKRAANNGSFLLPREILEKDELTKILKSIGL